jgi:type I restriction enzyme, S subunit
MASASATIPVGYKQTEVGVIPEDWVLRKLGSLGTFSKGRGITKSEANSGDIPSIRYGEIYNYHDDVIRSFNSHISSQVAESSKLLRTGDILFAGSGETREEIGKCVAFIDEIEAYAGGDVVIFSPRSENSTYLAYSLNSFQVSQQKSRAGQGDAVVHIYSSELSEVLISLPSSEEEQKVIADVITECEKAIQSLHDLITKKRGVKQGTMQELITGKTRLPGFTREWDVKELSECINVYRGGSPRPISNYLTENIDGINWIKIGDVSVGAKYIINTGQRIIKKGVKNSREVYSGDLLLSNSMSFGRPYILKIDGCIHDGWLVLQNYQTDFSLEFLFYHLSSDFVLSQYKQLAAGSSVLNLNKDIVSSIKLLLPSKPEQDAIAEVLSGMDAEIAALEQRIEKIKAIKQGMIQQLLTGRIRLVDPSSPVEASA